MELFTASQYVSPRGLLTPSQLFSTCYRTNKTTPWPLWGLAREYAGNSKKRIVNAVKFESTSVSKILISAKNWSLQKRNILSQPQVIARAMRERSSRNHSENHVKSSKFTKSWLSWKPKGSVKSCLMAILAEFVMLHTFFANPSAYAADALKTCACLLKECRVEFARCITDPACAANIACLQSCNNRPDETECQIKCGDLFENNVVDKFNECAVSRKNCVPRKLDEGKYPIPEPSVLVKSFNIADFSGKWYISSGLNPSFDTFDCQVHEFYPSESRLTGNLTWRISTPDGGFLTRSTVQRFVQDTSHPGILYNHDNEYLHYQDDWYILSSKIENKPDDYIFVYYRGKNDAWDGYGGSVVYTRSPTLPSSIVPELEKAARKVGLDFQKFRKTDNTCGPEPPLFARIEKKVIEGEQAIAKEVEEIEEKVEEVGKTEMTLLERLGKGFQEIKKDEENFLNVLTQEEKELLSDLKMEAEEVEKLFGKSIPIRKLR
eukprot:TRINITY_DN650_c0_g1_i3.p1 TRINITY_DN650_c0_g1~~TRINITY_DN650_c0_g1_i3.p1  ORF type:complete len:491 (-),score=115.71 TRINITY_DN650_c0_g1_i3:538-2010(-)